MSKIKKDVILFVGIILIVSFFIGCPHPYEVSQTPLDKIVKAHGYTMFNPLRSYDGVGTIISFDNKKETTVASKKTCLPDNEVPTLTKKDQAIALLSGSYSITKLNKTDFGFANDITKKKIDQKFNISGVIKLDSVKSIEVKWIAPFGDRIERIKVKDYARSLDEGNSCLEELVRKDNLIIHSVIGAEGISYKFIGNENKEIKINAKILKILNGGHEFNQKWDGKFGFEIKSRMLIGYRAWKASTVRGALKNDIMLRDISKKEISILKNN